MPLLDGPPARLLYFNPRVGTRADAMVVAYLHELRSGVVDEAARLGYALRSLGRPGRLGSGAFARVDGAIGIVYPGDPWHGAWRRLHRRIPCVDLMVGDGNALENYIGVDDAAGMGLLVDHLVARGHRRIAFFGLSGQAFTRERARGVVSALRRHRLPVKPAWIQGAELPRTARLIRPRVPEHLVLSYERIVLAMLSRWWDGLGPDKPTALCCETDRVAALAYRFAASRGLRLPEDLALTGYDDNAVVVGDSGYNILTTIRQDRRRLAALAVRMVHEIRMGQRPAHGQRISLAPELVVRRTTSPGAPAVAAKREAFLADCERLLARHLDEKEISRRLAGHFALETPYFLAKYRRLAGADFTHRVASLRLDRAAFELSQTRRSVTEIFHACGWRTHQAFCRAWKAKYGVTPQAWRERQAAR
ncbi:MAG: substrate-binding domain-containing protein [Spirochaetes bacterium]|nr:substrate-binding domain-containing protein [Spirochaetota bacterium]